MASPSPGEESRVISEDSTTEEVSSGFSSHRGSQYEHVEAGGLVLHDEKESPRKHGLFSYYEDMVNEQDVDEVLDSQAFNLQHFEKANEMLTNLNAVSQKALQSTYPEMKSSVALLQAMKTDLTDVFQRIRHMRTVLSQKYPDAFKKCEAVYAPPDEEDEETTN